MVDVLLSVSPVSSSLERMSLGSESSSGGSQLEGPQEVVGLLEVRSYGVDLVDEVLNSGDVVLSEGFFDDGVGGEGDSLSVDLAISSLEDEFADGFAGGVAEGDVGLDSSEHVGGGLVDSNEDSVVELSESEEPHDSDDFRVELVNTSDSDDEGESGLSRYVDLTGELSLDR